MPVVVVKENETRGGKSKTIWVVNRGPLRGLLELRNHLERVLDMTQNAPPLGESDGSITAKQWGCARKLLTTLNDLEVDTENWRRVCCGHEPLR